MATPAPRIVLLDVNGTLTDPAPIGAPWGRPELGSLVLESAVDTAMVDALLQTAARPFSDHIRAAIAVVVAGAGLDPAGIDAAAATAAGLPARPGADDALTALTGSGLRAVALTNSGAQGGAATLRHCGLAPYVERVIGVDAVRTFKPHPSVYAHALRELEATPAEVVLLATHPWDLAGAAHAGIRTAWVTHGTRGWPDVFPLPDVRGETLLDVAHGVIEVAGL
ncbi:MAG TPA: HAD family hydrolase [Solirubrobacteraceae bacterium]|nr:HAD family hydrolase [Solirubrobacteraceae bacterium]